MVPVEVGWGSGCELRRQGDLRGAVNLRERGRTVEQMRSFSILTFVEGKRVENRLGCCSDGTSLGTFTRVVDLKCAFEMLVLVYFHPF